MLIVAGILLNTHGSHKTRREYRELLAEIGQVAGRGLGELKGRDLYRGRGDWAGVVAPDRALVRRQILEWLGERSHKIVASGVIHDRLPAAHLECPSLVGISALALATTHVVLAIQRANFAQGVTAQRKKASLLFFDRQAPADRTAVTTHITAPPDWVMEFVGDRTTERDELSAVLDTAYFVDSTQAPLIQLADFVAFMIQRKATLDLTGDEAFHGETDVLDSVFEQLQPLLLQRQHRLPRQPETAAARALRAVSPTCLD